MKKSEQLGLRHPEQIRSYFFAEIPLMGIITVSGLIYNIGMTAGPYFEGQLAQCLYDIFRGRASFRDMARLALLYLLAIGVVQGMRAVKRYGVRQFANKTSRRMRTCLYHSLVHADPEALAREDTGSLLTKAISDVDACAEGMRKVTTEIFDTGVVMIAYTVMLLTYDWRLTLLCCLFTPIAYIAADRLKVRVSSANAAYKQSASNLNTATMDRISHAITYRIYGQEARRDQNYEAALTDYEHKSAAANLYESALAPLYDAIAMIGAAVILYFGSRNVVGTGWEHWEIAAFTTYLACFTKLAVKASHAAKLFNAVQKASVSWHRIQPLLKAASPENSESDADSNVPDEPDIKGIPYVPDTQHNQGAPGAPDQQNDSVRPVTLRFEDVSAGPLQHLNFTVRPGEILGVTGAVASGKSMLGKVLIDEVPYSGRITLNGRDFSTLAEGEKQDAITYMGHDAELLSVSFRGNIALGHLIDAEKYLSMVRLDDDLHLLNRTIDDPVGSGGTMLSGGQMERLSLARALAHAGSILVLDDPFASVDRGTETGILRSIRTAFPDRTIVLISHRLYHFPEFQQVLYLHDGTGTCLPHAKLMERESGYRTLYEGQMKGSDFDAPQSKYDPE